MGGIGLPGSKLAGKISNLAQSSCVHADFRSAVGIVGVATVLLPVKSRSGPCSSVQCVRLSSFAGMSASDWRRVRSFLDGHNSDICGSSPECHVRRIFRVLFFYQPGMLIVITSGFQKKTQETPTAEITRAEQLRKLWMKYRNRYTGSPKEREAILKELEL